MKLDYRLNSKGSVFVELLIASSIMLILLVNIYVQFSRVFETNQKSYNYNEVDAIYAAYNIRELIYQENLSTFENAYTNQIGAGGFYVELTDCNLFAETNYCENLMAENNVESFYLLNGDLLPATFDAFDSYLEVPDGNTKDFMKYVEYYAEFEVNQYFVIVKLTNNTFAYIII